MKQKERMLAGKLYMADDSDLRNDFWKGRSITEEFNQTSFKQDGRRKELLKDLFGEIGKNYYVETPFRCDYGSNIYIGDNFYANYNCILLDVCDITIGDNVFLAPNVAFYTAGHPIDPVVRNTGLEFGKPITVGNNVWIGGNTVVNPGVTIGNNVVLGSGSVVTKDIPDNVVAAGNPCRVLRELNEEDTTYWKKLEADYHTDMNE